MANNSDKGKFWPYMILGFVFIGIALGYWTVKHAINMPVHESNEYMMKYQDADKNANAIVEAQQRFDSRYKVQILDAKISKFKPEHIKRKSGVVLALSGNNTIKYRILDKSSGKIVSDANVSLLVTRPHTEKEDQLFKDIKSKDGLYIVDNIKLKNPGRYILRVRVQKGNAIGYKDIEGYYQP